MVYNDIFFIFFQLKQLIIKNTKTPEAVPTGAFDVGFLVILIIKFFVLINRLACQLNTQFLKNLDIYIRKHNGSMYLSATQFWKLGKSLLCSLVCSSTHGQGDQDFICMKTRVLAAKIPGF